MRVLLLSPPMFPFRGSVLNLNPPLGLLFLSSVLRREHEVKVLDCEAGLLDYRKILLEVKHFNPDVIGITSTSWSYYSARQLSLLLKRTFPKIRLILGGPHVSVAKEEVLQETNCDAIVIGEGENVINDALTSGKIIYGTKVEDINILPDWNSLFPSVNSGYIGNAPRYRMPETVTLWSRGCPHQCTFCCNPVFQHQATRFRKEENIIEELKMLSKDWRIKGLFVYDDELVGMSKFQTKWLKNICQRIIDEGLNFDIKCQGRCNPQVIDEELLSLMKKAGFRAVMLGCESGSDKVLKAVRKDTTVEDIKQTVKMVHEYGLQTWCFFMVGNLEETPEDVKMTAELIKELKPWMDYKQVTCCTPWRGSLMYEIAKEKNWIEDFDLSKYDGAYAPMRTDWLTREQMMKFREELLKL